MFLFIQAVSRDGVLMLFDDSRHIIAEQPISLLLNESSQLIPTVSDFLEKQNVSYSDVENIVVVHGPGSFTGIRTISLYVNTIAYIYPHVSLTPVVYFDLFETYPICKTSSKRDLFVKNSKNAIIEIVKNEVFESQYLGQKVYGDMQSEKVRVDGQIDYKYFLEKVSLKTDKRIAPLYIKKPNIS